MIKFARIPLKDFIKKYNPQEPKKETIENFKKEINSLLENAKGQDYEESQKSKINKFLKNTYGYECDIYGKVDSAIYVDGKAWVLIEVKALNNRNEFPKDRENPLSKAFCQMVFYFLKEIENNNSLKHAIICNAHEFFLFDCKDFCTLFQNDKEIKQLHKNCASNEGTDPKTKRFYSDLEEYLKKDFKGELRYTHFNLNSDDPKELIYQVLSHEVLLKQKKTLDANTLNKDFYEELLYILGLEEQNEKGKILIKPSRTKNSLSDALKKEYKNLDDEEVMALLIAWNNRILFLRLLESLLISFNHFEKPFLTIENFTNFNALNTLFFEVLAKKNNERLKEIKEDKILGKIPYLNSSLFDKTPLESNGHEIRLLKNERLEIYPKSILKKDKDYQEKKDFSLLEYLFTFLHVYDFTTTPKDIKDNKNTSESRLINPSVLGLVFEKLNGYKEGSFYTPSFITSYMCKESITPIVLDKFNAIYEWDCKDLEALRGKIDRNFSDQKAKEYLQVLLALRICDPAVGSGHFLVSALNEMVRIAYKLGLTTSLYRHSLRLENDEIIIQHTPTGEIFNYKKPHSENDPHHHIQKELFELKKSIIENCLFGVDINPNSCEITKLRLWIELLKYSYYIFEEGKNTNALETLPNIDINIKCGNSLISRFSLHDDLKKIPNIKKKIQEYKDLVAQYKDPNPLFPLNKTDLTNKIQDLKTTFSLELKDPKTKAELEKAIEKHIKKYNFFALDDKSLLDGLNYFIPNLFGALKLSPKEEEEAFASYGRIRALRKKLDDALSGREYQNAFEWRFEFPEVLDDEGDFLGFDCIIGNPPYIDYRKIDEKTKIFLSKFSSVYKKSKEGSIFVYFIELASQLIIKHGEISFINPIAYLCKPTDHGIRDYIDKNLKITMLIDLSNIKIFESASTYTCINIFKRENKKNEILFKRFDDFTELSSNKDDFLKIPSVNIEHIFIFLDPISRHIAERCKTQLGDFCKIFCGLSKTGFRSDVINTNSEKSVYFLESSDIYRYYVNDFGKKFLKRIDDYFSQEKRRIFESQDIIFMTRMTNQIRCVVVPLGVYGGKVNILSDFRIDRFLILGVLNSKLMTYFYKKKFFPTHMQGGAFGFDTLSVETLPIPQITKSNQPTADKITDCAKAILEAKEKDPKANTQELEKEIDALVYQLYNLTDEEIKIIEEGQEIKSALP
ncbi:Eco57I restriction-modification methylase domain-containing protein [Helicobacter pylori]|uniref:type IIG restriction enzyme/methyltransferase n=1 Tax=Helicobacter pylori TaxID=210 RepID=UPI001FD1E0C5|nr:Eco57I restriction-modification methylase domain-containing protein [Helicobacter pylori]UOS05928.1 Eco57I restriction-modification methylase domain-containing protein [Helicobacter pylori]